METEYLFVDKQNKIYYELGSGNWWLLKENIDAISDYEYLCVFILNEIFLEKSPDDKDHLMKTAQYVENRLAKDLYFWFGKLPLDSLEIIVNCDASYRLVRDEKYKCIGTRYFDKESEEYRKYLELENDALKYELQNHGLNLHDKVK